MMIEADELQPAVDNCINKENQNSVSLMSLFIHTSPVAYQAIKKVICKKTYFQTFKCK